MQLIDGIMFLERVKNVEWIYDRAFMFECQCPICANCSKSQYSIQLTCQ